MPPYSLFRMTRQRQVILGEIRKLTTHPTAEDLYLVVRNVMPHISLGTVYRNLEVLSSMGLVQKLECSGNQRRYDGNPRRHHHIRCVGCGSVHDVPSDVVTKFEYDPDRVLGYNVLSYSFLFIGICEKCRLNGVVPAEPMENAEE